MIANPPVRIAVCAAGRHAGLAQELSALLARSSRRAWMVDCVGLDSLPDGPDVLVQVVDAQALAPALAQLGAMRLRHPNCCSLEVLEGLDPDALRALLSAGASDFVSVSVVADELWVRVQRLLGDIARTPLAGAALDLPDLIGTSPAFASQVARLPMIARYDVAVLLLGETGTGKEVFAQSAHYLSPRAGNAWIAVNCGAIPGELVEDELFGHVRGAYTQAHAARPGLIREAEGGTLFLDEIDALPCSAQVKLLRFLQDKQYRPVGSSSVAHADVRVFAASNQPLAELAARGSFRQDLLFRLNVITLHLPPLRERIEDIVPLALHFLQAAARQWQRPAATLTRAAVVKLLAHGWPGNVRELKNVMDRAILLCAGGALTAEDIDLDETAPCDPAAHAEDSFRAAKERMVQNFERTYIQQLLASSGGNVTHAARAAQKNRRAFFELMRKYRIEPEHYRGAGFEP